MVPLVAVVPGISAQLVALVADQVMVEFCPIVTGLGLNETLTDGTGIGVVIAADAPEEQP